MLERLTQPARLAFFGAQTAVIERGGTNIEPEHIVLGLLGTPGSIGASVLTYFGVTAAIAPHCPTSAGTRPHNAMIPLSRRSQAALRAAIVSSEQASSVSVTTGHLLDALLSTDTRLAAKVMQMTGRDLEAIRRAIEAVNILETR